MEAFKVGDIIAPHYSLRLFDKHGNSNLILPTDVTVVLEVGRSSPFSERARDVTLLLRGGVVRQYEAHEPGAYEELFHSVVTSA